jgi:hypothetical protein
MNSVERRRPVDPSANRAVSSIATSDTSVSVAAEGQFPMKTVAEVLALPVR